jgi:glutamine phosphoribosylpyrophosphate amidotransferase
MKQNNLVLAVNGTLMRGLELENNLKEVGAFFIKESKTEKAYRYLVLMIITQR